jgi:hypothetical protein
MNTRSSAWTGRAPRTLEEAFGPYTSADFPEDPVTTRGHAVAAWVGVAILSVLCALIWAGVL